jgi:hypothetical protein
VQIVIHELPMLLGFENKVDMGQNGRSSATDRAVVVAIHNQIHFANSIYFPGNLQFDPSSTIF